MSDEFQVVPEKSLPKKKSKSRRSAARPAPVEEAVEVEQPAPSDAAPLSDYPGLPEALGMCIPDADEATGRAWAAGLTPGQRAWLRGAMEEVRFGE